MGINEDNDEFIKIIFEDYDYYNNKDNIDKIPYLNYLTTPNLCTIEDFEYQFISSMERHPIIECILNRKENEIINIMNILPKINSFINKIYNKKILPISKEEAENKTINDSDLNLEDEEINNFNNNILKLNINSGIENITNDSKLSKVLNIKENEIYKLYNNIIQRYNKFISQLSIYNNDKDFLLPLIVQDFSKEISFFKNPEEGLNELKKIICLYSKRNRLMLEDKNYKLNIYNGDKIDYDFQLIENILEKKYFINKNIFEKNHRTFIFSNNVFSGERNNLLAEIMEKYPQEKIKENIDLSSENESKETDISIYHNLQFIIINLKSLLMYSGKNTLLENISEILLKKYDYEIDKSFNLNDINANNIICIYEIIEEKCFKYFKNILIPQNLRNDKDNTIDDFLENLNLIKKDVISEATKKYLMRYCLGDYDKKENILKNMKIDKMFLKRDIWEESIFKDLKFKEECEKLKKLNNENDNYIDKYFLYNIFNDNYNDKRKVIPQHNINIIKNVDKIEIGENIKGEEIIDDYNYGKEESSEEEGKENEGSEKDDSVREEIENEEIINKEQNESISED